MFISSSSINSPSLPPVQSTLLSSIQRARQRIFSKSIKQQQKLNNNNNQKSTIYVHQQMTKRENDQNNSLIGNVSTKQLPSSQSVQRARTMKSNLIPLITQDPQKIKRDKSMSQIAPQSKQHQHQIKASNLDQSNQSTTPVVINAIKLLQQKILQLQNKNKHLEQQLSCKTAQHFTQPKGSQYYQQQEQQSDLKSYLLLKQQCQSLQKQNASLCEQLSKRKQSDYLPMIKQPNGRKLNFHHEISQNVSHVFVQDDKKSQLKPVEDHEHQIKQLTQQLQQTQQQASQAKLMFENEKKRNFTILKLHQEEIIRNQQLQLQLDQLKQKIKEYQQTEKNFRNSKKHNNNTITQRRNTLNNNNNNNNNNLLQHAYNSNSRPSAMTRQNHLKLQQTIATLRQQLSQEKHSNQQKMKQNTEIYQKYIQVKQAFIQLYKDLLKYHPQVVNTNIKFLYERVRKGEDIMLRSRSIMGYSRCVGNNNRVEQRKMGQRRSNTNNNNLRLNQFRSKSGRKGLKMEDLNSSKRSHSRDRTNSKNSNRSVSKSKSGYRSPYGQQHLAKRPTSKSMLSPNPKPQRYRSSTVQLSNTRKLSQIQKIIKQIKQLSREIKSIKSQHRNLSVKINTTSTQQHTTNTNMNNRCSQQQTSNQQRMNQLIEEYNQKSAKLQQLKLEKDRLAMETVPDGLLM